MEYQRRNGYVLVLRTCESDMTSHGGFVWPKKGYVKAPDWDPEPICGKGLHGLLWGEGDGSLLSWGEKTKWLVCEVPEDQIVDLRGKVKFPKAEVIYCGDRQTAVDLIYRVRPGLVMGATVTAGDNRTATTGDRGTAIAGDYGKAIAGEYGTATAGGGGTAIAGFRGKAIAGHCGTAMAGYGGTATAGDWGTATAGNYGTATAGDRGTAKAEHHGTATAGDDGTATAGNYGIATAGEGGIAIVGDYGTATAGYCGRATAGEGGTVMAGISGIIQILGYERKRIAVGYIGEDGLLPNTPYKLDAEGNFIKVE